MWCTVAARWCSVFPSASVDVEFMLLLRNVAHVVVPVLLTDTEGVEYI